MCPIRRGDRTVYETYIRPAKEEDSSFVATLGAKSFPYIKQPKSFFLERIKKGGVYIIEAGTPLGFVDIEDCKIMGIAVEESFRGMGLGRKLLSFAIEVLKKRGCKEITLMTLTSNIIALRLYREAGFVVKERRGEVVVMVNVL